MTHVKEYSLCIRFQRFIVDFNCLRRNILLTFHAKLEPKNRV